MPVRYRRLGRIFEFSRLIGGFGRYHFINLNKPNLEVKEIGTIDPQWRQMHEKLKYSPTESLNPQSKNKFRDIVWEETHNETTPEVLGLTFPYPEYCKDLWGNLWKRTDYITNNSFLQNVKRDRIAHFTTDKGNTFTPFWRDKDAKTSRPGTVRQGYIMSSSWKAQKDNGIL